MNGSSSVNPLSVPTRVPMVTQETINARTGVTAPTNAPPWMKFFQNVATILSDSNVSVSLGAVVMAFQAPSATWLQCNGAAISRANYPDLFGLIGTTFGAGDGSTTFNLPNLTAPAHLLYFMEAVL